MGPGRNLMADDRLRSSPAAAMSRPQMATIAAAITCITVVGIGLSLVFAADLADPGRRRHIGNGDRAQHRLRQPGDAAHRLVRHAGRSGDRPAPLRHAGAGIGRCIPFPVPALRQPRLHGSCFASSMALPSARCSSCRSTGSTLRRPGSGGASSWASMQRPCRSASRLDRRSWHSPAAPRHSCSGSAPRSSLVAAIPIVLAGDLAPHIEGRSTRSAWGFITIAPVATVRRIRLRRDRAGQLRLPDALWREARLLDGASGAFPRLFGLGNVASQLPIGFLSDRMSRPSCSSHAPPRFRRRARDGPCRSTVPAR